MDNHGHYSSVFESRKCVVIIMELTEKTCTRITKGFLPLSRFAQITVSTRLFRCLEMIKATWIGSKSPGMATLESSVRSSMVAKTANSHLINLPRALVEARIPSHQSRIRNIASSESTGTE